MINLKCFQECHTFRTQLCLETASPHYTPCLWHDECNSFGIVSVCMSVSPSVSLSRPSRRAYKLESWHGCQVEGYIGQVHRSKVGHEIKNVHLELSIDLWEPCLSICQRRNSGILLVGIWCGVFSKRLRPGGVAPIGCSTHMLGRRGSLLSRFQCHRGWGFQFCATKGRVSEITGHSWAFFTNFFHSQLVYDLIFVGPLDFEYSAPPSNKF